MNEININFFNFKLKIPTSKSMGKLVERSYCVYICLKFC